MRTGKLRPKAQSLFDADPGRELHVREAARMLGASPSATSAVLNRLESDGVVASRWVGRSLVFRAGTATRAGAGSSAPRRAMTAGFPVDPAQWEMRPYFMWDSDLSWREFHEVLRGGDRGRSAWAVARLLDHARWDDIWRLASPELVRRELPAIRVRHQDVWLELLKAGDAAR